MPDERVVMVKHPSPMLLRRKRGHKRARQLVATRTPVVLRTGCRRDLGESHAVVMDAGTLTWRTFEGALWYQVTGSAVADRALPGRPFDLAAFVDFLEGGPASRDFRGTDLDLATRRTPLVAMTFVAGDATRGEDMAGDDGLGIEIAEIHADGRDAASRDLRRFMDERVRVVDDAVLLRTCDPLVRCGPAGPVVQPFPQARDMSPRMVRHRVPLGYRPDDYRAGMAWEAAMSGEPTTPVTEPWMSSLVGAPYGSDTARLVAGLAAIAALGAYEKLREYRGIYPGRRGRGGASTPLEAAADEVSDWAGKAALGRLEPPEATEAVAAALGLARAVAAASDGSVAKMPMIVGEAMSLVRRYEEYELPLSQGKPTDADDLAALAALSR